MIDFLTKTLACVRTEMSLHVLAHNLKRVMHILDITEMMAAMRSRAVPARIWLAKLARSTSYAAQTE